MKCSMDESLLALFAGGDLADEQAREVEKHLRGCPDCRELAAGLVASQAALQSLRDEDLDANRLAEVRRQVLDRVGAARPAWVFAFRWWQAVPVGLAAAVLVFVLYPRPEIPPPPAPPVIAIAPPPEIRRPVSVPPKPAQEPLLVKMFTDDPDVVIYWLIDPKGDAL
jgi:anti-sigma factor RsiW